MIRESDRSIRGNSRQQPFQLVLAVCERLQPESFATVAQSIKNKEARLCTSEQEVLELWLSTFVKTYDLAIEDHIPDERQTG